MKIILSVLLTSSFLVSGVQAATFSAEELAARRAEAKARGDWLKAELEAAAVVNLSYFEFNDSSWLNGRQYAPLEAVNLELVPGWSSNAVSVDSSSPAILRYRDIEADGHTNFLAHRGSLRLWFKPNWSSMNWGGSGPGDVAVLFACGTLNATSSWWGLSLDPTGSRLSFAGQTNGTGAEFLHCPVALQAGEWHEIVLTYSATNSVLYLNGAMLATGSGVLCWPDAATRAARGFTIGSEDSGAAQARGAFENVALFDRPFRPAAVTNHYVRWLRRNTPGATNDDAASASTLAEPEFVFTGENWTGSTDLGGAAHYGTNTLWLELVQAPNPSILVVHGTEPGTYYQVLGKRHLEDEQWTIETSVLATSSNTTVTLPYFGRNPLFFLAGKDTDGDGLPDFIEDANHNGIVDAGETSFLDADSDGDGRTDAEELLYDGTNPLDGSDAAATRLGYWRFNSSGLLGQGGQTPLVNEGTQLIAAWSGSALQIDSTSSVRLVYRDVEPLGGANINCRMGSTRFWFKPNWNTSNGPGATGYFLTLGNTTTNADGWWALSVNSTGDHLSFVTATNGSTTTHFSTAINWTTGAWHQVVLTYNGTETKLYIDGTSAVTGSAVARWPRRTARAAGFTVGGNDAGGEQVRGQLDELETFNYVLSASEVSANYNQLTATAPIAIDLPGSINTNFITATLSGAVAAEMTAVVAPASRDSATWQPFADTISATLGSTNGDYTVYFGFRTILGTVLWTTNFITLDTVAPLITLENPPSSVVTNSLLHVHARVPESIRGDSIRWSLSNTLGVVSGSGGWADQAYDPVTFHWTTNWFACYDLRMTNGTNRLTLQVTDDAGNTTVTNFVLTTDFSGLTTAPVTTMLWPLNGMRVSNLGLVLRGSVDDPASLVSAEITTPTNGTYAVPVRVFMKGDFTSDDLLLDPGTNTVKLIAQNANGLRATNTFTLLGSDWQLGATIAANDPADPTVTVDGVQSDVDYVVWLNGVRVTDYYYDWQRESVPVLSGDDWLFYLRAIPWSSNGGNGTGAPDATGNPTDPQSIDAVAVGGKPAEIVVASYENVESMERFGYNVDGGGQTNYWSYVDFTFDDHWTNGVGGTAVDTQVDIDGNNSTDTVRSYTNITWSAIGGGTAVSFISNHVSGVSTITQRATNAVANPPGATGAAIFFSTNVQFLTTNSASSTVNKKTQQTKLSLRAGGRANPSDNTKWVLLKVTASRIASTAGGMTTNPIPFSDIKIGGKAVNAGATTNDGWMFLKVTAGTTTNVTPQLDFKKYSNYKFNVNIIEKTPVLLTRAFHPLFLNGGRKVPLLADMQNSYHRGSAFLASDGDGKIADNDSRLKVQTNNPTSLYRSDHAPAYVQFIIKNVSALEVYGTNAAKPLLPRELWDPRYFDITSYKNLTNLMTRAPANLNQVSSIIYANPGETNASPALGVTYRGENKSVFAPPTPTPVVAIHEWLHSLGIRHRMATNAGVIFNPGPLNKAVMNPYEGSSHTNINRYERNFINP